MAYQHAMKGFLVGADTATEVADVRWSLKFKRFSASIIVSRASMALSVVMNRGCSAGLVS